ncbi:MAG: hypothetical protein AAGL34_15175 [Bacteroidota bacterium]
MINKKSFFLFLFSMAFWSSSLQSQEEKRFFLDEDDFVISETVFENKKKSSIYFSERLYSEKGPVERLRFLTYMGIMDSTIHQQMNKLLSIRIQADTTKTFFIRYVDSVESKEKMKKGEFTRQTTTGPKNYGNQWRSFVISSKGRNRYNNKKVQVLHLYGHIQKEDKTIYELGWREDPSNIFKHLFMTLGKPNSAFVVIHPDGRFWLRHLCITDVSIKEMLSPEVWEKQIVVFKKEYRRLNPTSE